MQGALAPKLLKFNELDLKNWAKSMHLNPIPILEGLFYGDGGRVNRF